MDPTSPQKATKKTRTLWDSVRDYLVQEPGKGDMEVQGSHIVSHVCGNYTSGGDCQKHYCQWKEGKCVDPAAYQCAVQKKMIDCLTTKYMGPSFITPKFGIDEKCGVALLGQKRKLWQGCDRGIRTGEACDTDEDCPALHSRARVLKGVKFAPPKCIKKMAAIGCSTGLLPECKDLGFNNFAVMGL